jgi:hypothetical protein
MVGRIVCTLQVQRFFRSTQGAAPQPSYRLEPFTLCTCTNFCILPVFPHYEGAAIPPRKLGFVPCAFRVDSMLERLKSSEDPCDDRASRHPTKTCLRCVPPSCYFECTQRCLSRLLRAETEEEERSRSLTTFVSMYERFVNFSKSHDDSSTAPLSLSTIIGHANTAQWHHFD